MYVAMSTEENETMTAFESVPIDAFFDREQSGSRAYEMGIVVLTKRQKELVDDLTRQLLAVAPELLTNVAERMTRLEDLAKSLAGFPSLLERANLTADVRTPQALIESLIRHTRDGDNTLQLPSKATLGKGFLVAKIHTFAALSKLSNNAGLDTGIGQAFRDETVSMMFLLLAEDVYLNLIQDGELNMDLRHQLALSLLLLWEHRADQSIEDISPVLQAVWKARRTLAPAFGTMMGTSELIMISFQMDEQWSQFIKTQLSDTEVSQAMEEFLFGISFEQINKLKSILHDKGIPAIGRDEVSQFLGEHVKTDVSLDYRDFFTQYSIRRDNARTRRRMNLPGPHRTLEDVFIRFVMEQNRETQNNDAYAQEA